MQPLNSNSAAPEVWLCVDLDGTLIRTDLFWESLILFLKYNIWKAVFLPIWLLYGKAHLKQKIAERVTLEAKTLPYNEDFLRYLHNQHDKGRKLILITGSNLKFAAAVAKHLGIFSKVEASNATLNLVGNAKLHRIEALFPKLQFDYAGDSAVDLPLWSKARRAIVINAAPKLLKKVKNIAEVELVIEDKKPGLKTYLKAARIHQWLKNTLLFLPLMAAHELGNSHMTLHALIAFFAFSLCSSSGYVINDLLDLSSDRQHPHKKFRPFAAGLIPISHSFLLILLLLTLSFLLASLLPLTFSGILFLYLLSTISYSVYIKRIVIIDTVMLGGLYTLRVFAGGLATGVEISFWLLTLSIFLFFSLALCKRFVEIRLFAEIGKDSLQGRGYVVGDQTLLLALGIASGYQAVLVLALYLNSPEVSTLYPNPSWLWFLCPLLLYWITRIWFKSYRGNVIDDPLLYSLGDKTSLLAVLVGTLILQLAAL